MDILSTKRVYIVAAISLALGILFDYLFYEKQVGISFLIYTTLLLAGLFSFFFFFKVSYRRAVIWFLPAIIFFALMVGVRGSEFLQFFNIVLTLALLLLLAHQAIGRNIKEALFLDYFKTAVFLPLGMLGKAFNALGRLIFAGKSAKEDGKGWQIAKGILITLPVILLFLFLLSSADLAFKKLATDLFKFNFTLDAALLSQIWLAVLFAFLWLGAYVYILENAGQKESSLPSAEAGRYRLGNIEGGILFAALDILFFAFVVVQIKYLFAGHSAITQLGYTYAEYAHRGFGELVVTALLTFGLIFLAERYIKRRENKVGLLFKILTGGLIALVLVIMASAFLRLGIYEQAYGFTVPRILVQAFIIWLAMIFLWLGYKIIKNTADRLFVFGIFLSVIAFFVVFNLLNPDAFVARKNIDQFAKTGGLDFKYLSVLSADAIPELVPLLKMPEAKDKYGNRLSVQAATSLKNYHDLAANQPWQSYSASCRQALEAINSHWDLILTLASFGQEQTLNAGAKTKNPILGNLAMDEAVTKFLLSRQEFSWKVQDGSTNFCVFQNLNPDGELFPVYIWIRCGEFKVVAGELKELSGTSLPVKINYPNELSYYDLAKFSFEAPRDGSLYDKDVKRIFPENIWPNLHFDGAPLNQKILELASQSLLNH